MRSSQFIPNLMHGSRHTAYVYNWANICFPRPRMKECPSQINIIRNQMHHSWIQAQKGECTIK